jgi:hypothetical protein
MLLFAVCLIDALPFLRKFPCAKIRGRSESSGKKIAMSPPSSPSPPAPELPLEVTEEAFWSLVEEIAGGIEIHGGSEQMLRDMIRAGLKKMGQEGRDSPADIVLARGSLVTFILEMKREAHTLGHPEWLGEDTTQGASERFRTMGIKLWPFIPPPWHRW